MATNMLSVLLLALLCSIVSVAQSEPCSTAACNQAATFLKEALNTSVNPCEDFYEFTCGGWIAKHPIPESQSATGITEELEELQSGRLRQLLTTFDVASFYRNASDSSNESSASVAFTAHQFQLCMAAANESTQTGVQKVKQVVRELLGADWTIGVPENKNDSGAKTPEWYELFVKFFALGGIESVFSISVVPNPTLVHLKMFSLDSSDFGLADQDMANLTKNTKLVAAYKRLMLGHAKLLCGEHCNTALLIRDIDQVVELESVLAGSKRPQEDNRDPTKSTQKLTFAELTNRTGFDWLHKVVRPLFAELQVTTNPPSDTTRVTVSDLDYLVRAVKVLEITHPRILRNFFGWQAVSGYAYRTAEAFRDLDFEFARVHTGVAKKSERWRSCLGTGLGWAVSRLWLDHHFTAQEKHAAAALIDEVQASFRQLLLQNAWLDERTRNASVDKLDHVTKNVAYPEWIHNNTALDAFHALDNRTFVVEELLSEQNLLRTMLRYSRQSSRKEFQEYRHPVNVDQEWPMSPYTINAAYAPEQNSITIPAGQLVAPFFHLGYPASLNYGNLGATVGHELTHGLDDEGHQYDWEGNLNNWWTDEAEERFENRSECFVKQYSNEKERSTGLNLDGKNTLGENIADNGGLNEAYHAFQVHQRKHGASPTLAQLSAYSSDQLFFISYGYSWCSNKRTEALRNQIEYNVHSPAQYRVNIPVANSAEFARAFKCPAGAKLNPAKRCLLW